MGLLDGQLVFNGTIRVDDGAISNAQVSAAADLARSKMKQEAVKYIVPLTSLRVHNNLAALLPNPSASDDLGFPATQTFGTTSPFIESFDVKTLTTTLYARGQFTLPPEYEISAWTDRDEIMGVRHRTWPLEGVQYHPESFLTEQGERLLANFLGVSEQNLQAAGIRSATRVR